MVKEMESYRSFDMTCLLSKEYIEIFETGEFFDTEILVGENSNTKTFRLHSLILKVRSPYFRIALSNNWKKVENNIIKFKKPNISVKVFEILIKYMYSGKLDLENDVKTNIAILIAADELCLNELCIYIEEYLLKNEELLKQNLILIQDITSKFTQFKKLTQFYNKQDDSLIFQANDFTSIKQEVLLDIISKQHKLGLKPVEFWDKIKDWAIVQSSGLTSDTTKKSDINIKLFKTLIQPFISFINFKKISKIEFFRKVKPYKYAFDDKFYIEIMEYYCFDNIQLVNYIDSQMINLKEASFIANWISIMKQQKNDITYDFNLLVRGSRDGFSEKTFHEFCDNKGPTITIVRVKNSNEILGGFNPCNWISEIGYNSVEESFIFSLDRNNLEKSIFSKVIDNENAIYNSAKYGPCFGGGGISSDFELFYKEKQGQCIKESYEKAIRQDEEYFKVDDYEVFQVIIYSS
ncbi:BTB-domain-containing protein [Rhizophagus irregularis]|uniref:BTB-domain-containing protein n=1 Tax=Rhizophagus irregularis TaxID=588596 RepID=A0A2N1MME1_9GLOM|nr:BTB-domain-containing protein [Rhizophagus irregularis]